MLCIAKIGDFCICVFAGQPALLVRVRYSIGGKIHHSGQAVMIKVSNRGILVKDENHVIYKKFKEILLCLEDKLDRLNKLSVG